MKKILILLLALTMVLPIVACRTEEPDAPQTSQTGSIGTEADTTTEDLSLGLPNMDLDGFTMTMLRSSTYFVEEGVWSEEEISGDHVSEAIYKRNLYIEDTYKCNIELLPTKANNPATEIDKYVSGGDDTVDMLIDGPEMILLRTPNFVDLNQLDYFDFSKPWWNQAFNEGVSMGDKLFLTVGSYGLAARKYVFHMLFDKTVAEDINVDPDIFYELVNNDEWTLEQLTQYAQRAKSDLNGDGAFDAVNDRFGLVGQIYTNWSLALGAGVLCVEKDEDDMPVVVLNSERNHDILEAIQRLTDDSTVTLYAERMTGVDNVWLHLRDLETATGRWLFICGNLNDYMRTKEGDYGVLPMPKYDEQQERYYHDGSLSYSPTTSIPISATDPNKVAFILEAMSYYSYKDVLPTFYQNFQNTKLVRDEQSIDMLQLIHDSLYYDLGAIYNWGGMRVMVHNFTLNQFDSVKDKIQTEMEDRLNSILAQ